MRLTDRMTSTLPIVIAHRGASGYRPEHTLAAYELAIKMGADFIEPDLVSTADGILVARHENEISATTNVAAHREFAARHTTKVIDGKSRTGWFTEDFTLEELKTLRAIERIPRLRRANTRYDGRFEIATFDEVINLTEQVRRSTGRDVGIYPETKHPTYFDSIGHDLNQRLVQTLSQRCLNSTDSNVLIQSKETGNLRALSDQTDVGLIQLVPEHGQPYDLASTNDPRTSADLVTPAGLAEIATYAAGIGAHKNLVITRDVNGRLATPTPVVADAHAAGLLVHVWTMRDENKFLPTDMRRGADLAATGDAFGEYDRFFAAGVDGVFSDHPDTAIAARRRQAGH